MTKSPDSTLPASLSLAPAAVTPGPSIDSTAVNAAVPQLRVKLLSQTARLPTRGSPSAAGFDLYASAEATVPAGGRAVVKTDLALAIPEGTYGRVAPRSGLAVKHFIDTGAGVIDSDYRGPLGVVLFNFGTDDFKVNVGDRIAQLILEKYLIAPAVEVDDLDETVRGAGGFGSTGVSLKSEQKATTTETAPSPGTKRTVACSSSAAAEASEEDHPSPKRTRVETLSATR